MNRPSLKFVDRLTILQIDGLGVAIGAVLAAVWYFAGLEPLSQARADRRSALSTLEERSREASGLSATKSEQERALAATRASLENGVVRLDSAEKINDRVGRLTELARETGLRLDQIKPGAGTASTRFTTVPIRVSGTGRYPGFSEFLHRLHSQFPDIGLATLNLIGEPEMGDRDARFAFDLVWYAAPEGRPVRKSQQAP
jgi:Tfp pilus assembly protein PilO